MIRKNVLYAACLLPFIMGAIACQSSIAQLPQIKSGDKVQVKFLSDWYDAEVTEVLHRGKVIKATFTDKRGRRREGSLFAGVNFRAIARPTPAKSVPKHVPRTWMAANGKFSTSATFVGMDGANVKLQKEDGDVISVPLTTLSKKDNQFLKKLLEKTESNTNEAETEGNDPGVLTPNDSFSLADVPMIKIDIETAFATFPDQTQTANITSRKITLGELPFSSRLKQFVFDRSGSSAIGSVLLQPGPNGPMLLFLIDMKTGRVRNKIPFPLSQTVFCDVNSDGTMLLTRSKLLARENRVDLWKLNGKNIDHHASWRLPETKLFAPPMFASFTNDDNVVTLSMGGNLVIWETAPVKPVAKLKTDYKFSSFTRNSYQISRDRKYIYCMLNGFEDQPSRLVTIDLVNHKCLGMTEFDQRNNALAVHSSGKKTAILAKGILTILDQESNVVDEMSASWGSIVWLNERFLAIRRGAKVTVFDTVTRVPLWSYMAMGIVSMVDGGNQDIVVDDDGQFWVSNLPGQKSQLTPFKIPHDNAIANLPKDPDSVLLFTNGMTVSIELEIINLEKYETARIQDHFKRELEKQGLIVVSADDNADLRFKAWAELGAKKTTQYEDSRGKSAGSVRTQATNMHVQIFDNQGLAWQRKGTVGASPMDTIVVSKGQSAQSVAGGFFTSEKFFLETKLPMHVVRQPQGGAYGYSKIDQGKLIDEPK